VIRLSSRHTRPVAPPCVASNVCSSFLWLSETVRPAWQQDQIRIGGGFHPGPGAGSVYPALSVLRFTRPRSASVGSGAAAKTFSPLVHTKVAWWYCVKVIHQGGLKHLIMPDRAKIPPGRAAGQLLRPFQANLKVHAGR
jgi:hypothetical protein